MSATAAKIPLAEQIAEVEGEIRQRCRVYPKWVADGRYKKDTADKKLAAMRAVQSTLIVLDRHMHWIRPELERRLRDARLAAEADALREHPSVAPILEEFPDAEIVVRDLPEPANQELQQ